MKGDFNQAVQFLWTFQQKISGITLKKLTLQIYKQKLYELLQNPNQTLLRNLFQKQIINVCLQQQYQHLFTLLTCRSVKEIPGMDNWTPMKGRYACFQQIQPHLSTFFSASQYQRINTKNLTFTLQEALESFITAQQKVEQRMQKSQNSFKAISTRLQKQMPIQQKIGKYTNPSMIQPTSGINGLQQKPIIQNNSYNRIATNQSYKPIVTTNIQNVLHTQSQTQNSVASSKKQINDNSSYEDIQMSESKVQKPSIYPKYDQEHQLNQNQVNKSNVPFNKKYNPFVQPEPSNNIASNLYQKSKVKQQSNYYNKNLNKSNNMTKNYTQQAQQEVSYSKMRQKEKAREKQLQKQRESEKFKDKKTNYLPSYLKQFQKQQDSQMFHQQIKRNIAYLDQNNSVVEKQQQNQNFTFSNGAQQTGQSPNLQILKLTSLLDPKAIRTCQFSLSGNFFALGTNSSYLKIYDVSHLFESNKPQQISPLIQIPQLHTKSIYCLAWSRTQKSVLTCSNDLTIKITEIDHNNYNTNPRTNVIGRHQSSVRMVKFNSLQNKVVSCSDDALIKVWDIGKLKKCTNFKGHTQSISAFRFGQAESTSQNILYSVSKDCTVRKWDLRVADCVKVSQMHDCQLTYIADNTSQIVVSDKSGSVIFYNQQLIPYNSIKVHEQQIRSIDGTNYDQLLLTASFDGHICLFSQKNQECLNYHQHNEKVQDKVVFATFMNHQQYRGFASTSTMGICNVYSFQ